MAKLKLNKHALQGQRSQLQLFERLLPSLDMKRRQLTVELARARREFDDAGRIVSEQEARIGRDIPMLADTELELTGLLRLKRCILEEENVLGVRLPVLRAIEVETAPYSMMARPAWVDQLIVRLREAAEQRMRVDVAGRRVQGLEHALRQITQRVNLFERILIPEAERNIRRIKLFLGELERDAVVRSKLAKLHGTAARKEVSA